MHAFFIIIMCLNLTHAISLLFTPLNDSEKIDEILNKLVLNIVNIYLNISVLCLLYCIYGVLLYVVERR